MTKGNPKFRDLVRSSVLDVPVMSMLQYCCTFHADLGEVISHLLTYDSYLSSFLQLVLVRCSKIKSLHLTLTKHVWYSNYTPTRLLTIIRSIHRASKTFPNQWKLNSVLGILVLFDTCFAFQNYFGSPAAIKQAHCVSGFSCFFLQIKRICWKR